MPLAKGLEGVTYVAASEEHGRLSVGEDSGLRMGDKMEFIVSHCCTNVNLYDQYILTRGGSVEAEWEISARGRVQ